tara:strand:- start:57 stop:596 length:540 start_codon:yes stop_codon:yes gene_type:complete
MACTPTLADVTFSCDDLGIGGLKSIYLGHKSALTAVTVASGVVTIAPTGAGLVTDAAVVKVQFNLKDGFSVFTDVKTVSADGITTTVPTIAVEIPSMSSDHRDALDAIAQAGVELVAFVETAAGTKHLIGYDFGLYASSVDGTSGTGRSEKNRYQLTLTGEEGSLAYNIADAEWADVIA